LTGRYYEMAVLRSKARENRVYIDTSDDVLTLIFTRNPSTTKVQVLRNGKPLGIEFTMTGKEPACGLERARFEGLVPTDRRFTCPRCHMTVQ
jgi:hypothetical protein